MLYSFKNEKYHLNF